MRDISMNKVENHVWKGIEDNGVEGGLIGKPKG